MRRQSMGDVDGQMQATLAILADKNSSKAERLLEFFTEVVSIGSVHECAGEREANFGDQGDADISEYLLASPLIKGLISKGDGKLIQRTLNSDLSTWFFALITAIRTSPDCAAWFGYKHQGLYGNSEVDLTYMASELSEAMLGVGKSYVQYGEHSASVIGVLSRNKRTTSQRRKFYNQLSKKIDSIIALVKVKQRDEDTAVLLKRIERKKAEHRGSLSRSARILTAPVGTYQAKLVKRHKGILLQNTQEIHDLKLAGQLLKNDQKVFVQACRLFERIFVSHVANPTRIAMQVIEEVLYHFDQAVKKAARTSNSPEPNLLDSVYSIFFSVDRADRNHLLNLSLEQMHSVFVEMLKILQFSKTIHPQTPAYIESIFEGAFPDLIHLIHSHVRNQSRALYAVLTSLLTPDYNEVESYALNLARRVHSHILSKKMFLDNEGGDPKADAEHIFSELESNFKREAHKEAYKNHHLRTTLETIDSERLDMVISSQLKTIASTLDATRKINEELGGPECPFNRGSIVLNGFQIIKAAIKSYDSHVRCYMYLAYRDQLTQFIAQCDAVMGEGFNLMQIFSITPSELDQSKLNALPQSYIDENTQRWAQQHIIRRMDVVNKDKLRAEEGHIRKNSILHIMSTVQSCDDNVRYYMYLTFKDLLMPFIASNNAAIGENFDLEQIFSITSDESSELESPSFEQSFIDESTMEWAQQFITSQIEMTNERVLRCQERCIRKNSMLLQAANRNNDALRPAQNTDTWYAAQMQPLRTSYVDKRIQSIQRSDRIASYVTAAILLTAGVALLAYLTVQTFGLVHVLWALPTTYYAVGAAMTVAGSGVAVLSNEHRYQRLASFFKGMPTRLANTFSQIRRWFHGSSNRSHLANTVTGNPDGLMMNMKKNPAYNPAQASKVDSRSDHSLDQSLTALASQLSEFGEEREERPYRVI